MNRKIDGQSAIAQAELAGKVRAEEIRSDPYAVLVRIPHYGMIPYDDYCYLRDLHGECTEQMETAYRDAFNAALGGEE